MCRGSEGKSCKQNFCSSLVTLHFVCVPRVRIELTWRVFQTRALTNFATSAH